ncbi:MAG: prepilin-type N-terminal cleavage/methylation domain-containing protein [Polaromonas sp.]|nr:prepilin-type N-terminal cleavage/methylation domain-containing protein [Polaromonas sp.]
MRIGCLRLTLASRSSGFTLIELLVAISIMALMAVLSWRGLDGMARTQALTSQRADDVLTLQAGLAQWKLDLDMLAPAPNVTPIDWDGRVLRLTRRTATAGEGLQVVAWTRRNEASGQWLRWQSPVIRTAGSWNESWERAGVWAQNASAAERTREVRVSPLEDWQIFYYRGGAWSNPLSSAGTAVPSASNTGITSRTPGAAIPDGVRLVLTLPAGQAIAGKLTADWVAPTLGGDKS